jgi:small subunit ribosomal protein S9
MVVKTNVKKAEPKTKEVVAKAETKVYKKAESKPAVAETKVIPKKVIEAKKEHHVEHKPVVKSEVKEVAIKQEPKKPKVTKKSSLKIVDVKAKRKTAVARAFIKTGKGKVTINKVPYKLLPNKYYVNTVEEPLLLASQYKPDLVKGVDINVIINGGGFSSRMIAARSCIAKALVKFYDDKDLRNLYFKYDRTFLVDDTRRKERKKQLGRGARAKKQHSKR